LNQGVQELRKLGLIPCAKAELLVCIPERRSRLTLIVPELPSGSYPSMEFPIAQDADEDDWHVIAAEVITAALETGLLKNDGDIATARVPSLPKLERGQ
jgi:hypothetical protein